MCRSLILLASAVLIGGMAAVAAQASRSMEPPRLVGDLGKTVTAATWRKNGITYEPVGHWGIEITKQGVTSLHLPPGNTSLAPLTTMRTSTTGASIVFGPTADGFCDGGATYTWNVAGPTLTLKLV